MAEIEREVEIETVAEVQAVRREAVTARYFSDERLVSLSGDRYGDYVYLTWPLDKTPEVIAALQQIYDAEKAA
ncbi:hypothetical protein [Rhizorhabdus sp.]|uniref:hypothetical protein n=1 Tax=Rhizorhabdus sp. TaxID=1968843 RepID=UPI0019A7769B|nr:hypothetical protein [Rhizorhabdus sp.]MBD3762603.1 hypothetical protein [Rhizorhabdus sp.]